MRSAFLVLAIVSIVGLSNCLSEHKSYNDKYSALLNGQTEITNERAIVAFADFLATYKNVEEKDAEHYMDKFETFKANLKEIAAHNRNPARTYNQGVTAYSDMTAKEFMEYFNLDKNQKCSATDSPNKIVFPTKAPKNFDWRSKNAVTPVKNQKSCGSCWAFSTVGALESHYNITQGKPGNFSEQMLVSCAQAYDCHGCSGGLPSYAFNYVRDHGLSDEAHYKYTAVDFACYAYSVPRYVTTSGPYNITENDEKEMKDHLYHKGPVSCAFQVSSDFRNYISGVYTSTECKNSRDDINHAVLCVGYGHSSDSDLDYWAVKNSWGTEWGMDGFFEIERGVNMCGIGVCNSYPENVKKYKSNQMILDYLRETL